MTARQSRRGELRYKQHCVRAPGEVISHVYPWSPEGAEPATEPWTCSCGATGDGQGTAEAHLTEKIKPAWRRLDDAHAWAAAAVSDGDRDAKSLIGITSVWWGTRACADDWTRTTTTWDASAPGSTGSASSPTSTRAASPATTATS